jgi:tetratricopeptide (TPR) repeat protein
MSSTELNKQEAYLDNVLTIKQFFNRHRFGGYMFAVSYSYLLKKEVNREIIEYCKDQDLTVGEARIEFGINKTSLQQLQEAKEAFKNGLILTNIDELMLLTHDEFAYQLNQMREALFALQIPILIWLTPETHRAFTHKAIDLYTRRDLDTLFFPETNIENTNRGLIERSELRLGQEEDAETLRTRIFLLEKQLEASRNDEISRERVAKEIVFPLIKAYRQMLFLEPAMHLMNEFKDEFENNNRDMLVEFGELFKEAGHLDDAFDYFEKALRIDIKDFGEESDNVAWDYNELGGVSGKEGKLDKAISYYEKALAIDLKIFGEEHPNVASNYNNLGLALGDKGDLNKAISYFEKALAINLKLFGGEHPNVASNYNNLGYAWYAKNALDKAISYFEKALAISLKIFSEEHPNVASNYNNLGLAWKDKGDLNKAINYLEKALTIDLRLFGEEHPNVAIDYNSIGTAWQDRGDLDKAKSFYYKAYNILSKTYGAEHPFTKGLKSRMEGLEKKESINAKTISS